MFESQIEWIESAQDNGVPLKGATESEGTEINVHWQTNQRGSNLV